MDLGKELILPNRLGKSILDRCDIRGGVGLDIGL